MPPVLVWKAFPELSHVPLTPAVARVNVTDDDRENGADGDGDAVKTMRVIIRR